MGTDSFIIHIKIKIVYEDIAYDVKKRFDTSNYEINRPFQNREKSDWINERQIRRNIMTEFVALRPNTYSYLIDDDNGVKKAKGTKYA